MNKVTPVSLGYPLSVFNKNSTPKESTHSTLSLSRSCLCACGKYLRMEEELRADDTNQTEIKLTASLDPNMALDLSRHEPQMFCSAMQCVTSGSVCCSVMQCVAVCCCVLQFSEVAGLLSRLAAFSFAKNTGSI